MNQEPGTDNITLGSRPREDDIAELLLSPQLIESGLFQILHGDLIEQIKPVTVGAMSTTILEIGHQARVFVGGLGHGEVKSMEVVCRSTHIDETAV